jgi:hypothetical protein
VEPALVILIAFIVLAGAGAMLLTGQGRSWSRAWAPRLVAERTVRRPSELTDETTGALAQHAIAMPTRDAIDEQMLTSPATLMPVTFGNPPASGFVGGSPVVPHGGWDAVLDRFERIEASIEALGRASGDRERARETELHEAVRELSSLIGADTMRRDAAIERLRGDVFAAIASASARQSGASGRRPEASAELYGRLASLETALAALTNPMLLPGEPYFPPAELLAETFIWDNWNEVGEKAFAFAETYSTQRLHLTPETRAVLSEFVTLWRRFLTGAIYPNLQLDSGGAQQAAMRSALDEIALALPQVREVLEREYNQG